MPIPDALGRLRDTTVAALESFDRENALASDRHAPRCDCAACELVASSRELVRWVDEMEREGDGEPPWKPTPLPSNLLPEYFVCSNGVCDALGGVLTIGELSKRLGR